MAVLKKLFDDKAHSTLLRPADVCIDGRKAKITYNPSVTDGFKERFVHTFRFCALDSGTGIDGRSDFDSVVLASASSNGTLVEPRSVHRLFGHEEATYQHDSLTPVDDSRGCEDAGVVKFAGVHLVFSTAVPDEDFDTRLGQAPNTRVAVAVSFDDLKTATKLGVVGPDLPSRGGFVLPEIIEGRAYFGCSAHRRYSEMVPLLYGFEVGDLLNGGRLPNLDAVITFAHRLRTKSLEMSDTVREAESDAPSIDDFEGLRLRIGTTHPRAGYEFGPAPVRVSTQEWLMVVNEIQDEVLEENPSVWRPKFVALDAFDPQVVTRVAQVPAFWSPPDREATPLRLQSAMFAKGLALDDQGDVLLTYGFADTTSCVARAPLDEVLDSMTYVDALPDEYFLDVPPYFDTYLPGEPWWRDDTF